MSSVDLKSSDANGRARVILHNKKVPVLSAGRIDPQNTADWEREVEVWFSATKISEADQVANILGCFSNNAIIYAWTLDNRAVWLADETFSFSAFMMLFRGNFLPDDWEDVVLSESVRRRMRNNESFEDFYGCVTAGNLLLRGTSHFLSQDELRTVLKNSFSPDLAAHFQIEIQTGERERLKAIKDLNKWAFDIVKIDQNMHRANRKRASELEDYAERGAKC